FFSFFFLPSLPPVTRVVSIRLGFVSRPGFTLLCPHRPYRSYYRVAYLLPLCLPLIFIFLLLLVGLLFLFLRLPPSFLPLEDRGMFTTSVQLPSGSTQQQTLK
ncbi:efflux RND transporter permease subunit, partial [Escherichia coli]|uniref:efflux RND transporter permease subunit n=1 Tax=Escherichia coli TaxID=562 RepID=UPI0010CB3029